MTVDGGRLLVCRSPGPEGFYKVPLGLKVGPSLAGGVWGAGASAHKAFSDPIRLLPEGEHVWTWFPVAETTSQAAVPTEPEAGQMLLGPKGSRGLGEN